MPPKNTTKGKSDKQRKDNQPKEEMPTAQPTETEGKAKEAVEEKSPAVVVGPSTAEKTTEELWEECVSLQDELERVRKQKKHFKIERDKAQRSWDNSKRNLEETKARMREKLRLKQEAEKCCRAEIKEHEEKLKQLETAHHNEICELKVAALKTRKEHVESEVELQKKMHSLQADKGEKESCTKIYIMKQKQQKQQDELRELNESYEKQVREMAAQHNNKMEIKAEENKIKIQAELMEINERMKKCTESVLEEHESAWRNVNSSVKYIHHECLRMEKLERQLEAAMKKDSRLDRMMAAAVRESKHLTESLREIKPQLCESRRQLTAERKAMAKSLKRCKKMSEHILAERRDLYLKHQQLELRHEQAQREYDALQERQTEAILDVQQKSGLKALVLERKIKAVTEIQEKEQLKLWVALTFGQGDQNAAENIKELFESKDAAIKALKDDVSQGLKEYDDLVKKVTALDISVDKWLPSGDIKKSTRNDSKDNVPLDHENFDNLMQGLTALVFSEDHPVQKDALGLNTAGAESRQGTPADLRSF